MFLNFVAFQAAWFAAVLSAAAGSPWIAAVVVALVVAIHLWRSARPRGELGLVIACAVLGGAWDSLLVAVGWVAYPSGMVFAFAAPYWIVAMWMSFATTLNVSLAWLKGRDALAVAFGAAGGPLAYFAGEKLGGIVLVDRPAALVALGLGWAIMMPLLLRLADRIDRGAPRGGAAQWLPNR